MSELTDTELVYETRRILGSLDGYPHTDWLDDLRALYGMDRTTSAEAMARAHELADMFKAVRNHETPHA